MADEVEVIERSAPVEVQLSTSNIIYRGPQGTPGSDGTPGPRGQSAYEIALDNGFVGTPIEWVNSLKGADGVNGQDGTDGKSAYEIAVEEGFEGNVEAWLASLHGANGSNGQDGTPGTDGQDGKSAYEIAVDNGFEGNVQSWLASLQGTDGANGSNGTNGKSAYEIAVDNGYSGTEAQWLLSLKGADGTNGTNGVDGKSAYEIAVDNGFVGTEAQWLASLQGDTPIKGTDYFTSQDIADFIAQVPDEISVYEVKAWNDTYGDTTASGYVDLRAITAADKIVFETIWADLWTNTKKIILLWLGANGGNKPTQYNISAEKQCLCVCELKDNNSFWLIPIHTNSPQMYYSPKIIGFDGNDELTTTLLDFSIIYQQDYFIQATNPITNQTQQRLDTVLTSMNTTYATKAEVETAIRGAESGLLKRSVVQTLPISSIDDNTIYMVPKTGSTGDVYDEYLYVNNTWEHIGSTDIDLTGYATTSYVDSKALPTAPVSDGDYILKCSISSSAATYSWESVVIGGSY